MKVLIVVASKHGSTREIAEVIGEELRAARHTVDIVNADKQVEVPRYEAVILGSAIYAGNWLPEAQRFAEQNRAQLSRLPVWVFSSVPLGAMNPQPHDDPARLAAPLGDVEPRDHHVFVGKLDASDLSFAERMIAKVVRAPEGDFRDWPRIRAWAQQIAGELKLRDTAVKA